MYRETATLVDDMRQIALQECLSHGLLYGFEPLEYRWRLERARRCRIVVEPALWLPGKLCGACADVTPSGGKLTYWIYYRAGLPAHHIAHTLFHELGHIALWHQLPVDFAHLRDDKRDGHSRVVSIADLEAEAFADAMTLFAMWGIPTVELDARSASRTGRRTPAEWVASLGDDMPQHYRAQVRSFLAAR